MNHFVIKEFVIPQLKGISRNTIDEHLKLYAGYVKNANLIQDHIVELSVDSEKYAYELGELQRRFAFEFDGMRNHEYYFSALESGASQISNGELKEKITRDFESFELFMNKFKATALTRGIGWAMLFYDKQNDCLLTQWIDEQHLGHLTDCRIILALDMWEHSFVADYQPSGKKQYVEDFFANLNWTVIEDNYAKVK